MTKGNHYFFKMQNWFKNAETNLLSRYHLAHFELKGHLFQGIKEGVRILESSELLKEVIIHVPEFNLLQTTEMTESDYNNLIHSYSESKIGELIEQCGMLISSGKTTLPVLFHNTVKADLHLSDKYFYISGIRELVPNEPAIYFQSEVFERSSLDFGSQTRDVPILS